MIKRILIVMTLMIVGCHRTQQEAILYLSNVSSDRFENANFKVYIDNKLILSDSVRNQYISSFWSESEIEVPIGEFDVRIAVSGHGYELERDTTVTSHDSIELFVRFNFYPYYKRYKNPDIYKFINGETSRLKEIADSLYAIKALPKADEYLNDTIPLKRNIEIFVK